MEINSTVLVTGGTGFFGRACVERLLHSPKCFKVIVFSRSEEKQWKMQKEIKDNEGKIRYFLGDIRDKERLNRALWSVDIVIHAAALKQVPALEYNPIEAIKTNILGTQNLINSAIDCGVNKVLMISTDKAVNPVNLYGATKLCAEKLMIASNVYGRKKTKLSVIRYGNVIGSTGSIIPLFHKQKKTGTLTITDANMTRFWISLDDSVGFVLKFIDLMNGGEIFIPKMSSKKIIDIAREICPVCDIKYIGIRKGEKLHESLVNSEEKVKEFDDYYIIDENGERIEYSSCK